MVFCQRRQLLMMDEQMCSMVLLLRLLQLAVVCRVPDRWCGAAGPRQSRQNVIGAIVLTLSKNTAITGDMYFDPHFSPSPSKITVILGEAALCQSKACFASATDYISYLGLWLCCALSKKVTIFVFVSQHLIEQK